MAVYHHGVEVHETTDLSTLIRDIDTSVIGIVCTAEDADPEMFPLDTPVLVTRIKTVLSKAGKTGTLYTTLKAIDDQCSPKIVIVRVPEAKEGDEKTQDQLVIGGTGDNGRYTGLYALLTAEANIGERPRILAVPKLDTKPVAMQLAIFAEQIKAFAYISANGCKTIAEAKKYREDFNQREVMIIYPDLIAYNLQSGKNETIPATAYPQLMGIIPQGSSSLGDIEKAAMVFWFNELLPLMENMKSIHDMLGVEVIRFKQYALLDFLTQAKNKEPNYK